MWQLQTTSESRELISCSGYMSIMGCLAVLLACSHLPHCRNQAEEQLLFYMLLEITVDKQEPALKFLYMNAYHNC